MKAEPICLTTPYPSLQKMAKTLGASRSEISQAKRLVRALVLKKAVARKRASKTAAR